MYLVPDSVCEACTERIYILHVHNNLGICKYKKVINDSTIYLDNIIFVVMFYLLYY